jgi:sugar phosphate isomerase/epimerase
MKIGVFAFMMDENGVLVDVETFTHFAASLKVDTVEYHLRKGFESHEKPFLLKLRRLCDSYGLPIGYLGSTGGFIGTDGELRAKIDQVKGDIDVAEVMGVPILRLMGGRPGDDDPDPETTWKRTISCFQEVADYAAIKSVTIGVHNHGPAARPMGEDMVRIIRDTGRENVTLIMDTGQWWPDYGTGQGGEFQPNEAIYDYMEHAVPHASYVRAKFYKIDSGREEYIDYKRVADILKRNEYDGPVSVVFEGQRYSNCTDREALAMAVEHLRETMGVPAPTS